VESAAVTLVGRRRELTVKMKNSHHERKKTPCLRHYLPGLNKDAAFVNGATHAKEGRKTYFV